MIARKPVYLSFPQLMCTTPPVSQTFKKASVNVQKRSTAEITNEIYYLYLVKWHRKKNLVMIKRYFFQSKTEQHTLSIEVFVYLKCTFATGIQIKRSIFFLNRTPFTNGEGYWVRAHLLLKKKKDILNSYFTFKSLATYCTNALKGFLKLNNKTHRNCIYLQY